MNGITEKFSDWKISYDVCCVKKNGGALLSPLYLI